MLNANCVYIPFPSMRLSLLLQPMSLRVSFPQLTTVLILTFHEVNNPDMLIGLYHSWNNEFFGKSLDVLRDLLLAEEREFKSNFYAKMIPIIQSSGTGKSRLMDEIGKEFLSISFVLRHPGQDGFPPGDHEVTTFLTKPFSTEAELHARVAAFITSALAQCKEISSV